MSIFFKSDREDSRKYKETSFVEGFVVDVTEDILLAMEDANVSKSQLSSILGLSKARITQLLSGSQNLTLRTLARICFALDLTPVLNFRLHNGRLLKNRANETAVVTVEAQWLNHPSNARKLGQTRTHQTSVASKNDVDLGVSANYNYLPRLDDLRNHSRV